MKMDIKEPLSTKAARPRVAAEGLLTFGVACLLTAIPAQAADTHPATVSAGRGAYVFGDSAAEMGNLYLVPGLVGDAPATSYIADGWTRESNGPVWNERLAPGMRPVNAGGPHGNRVNFAHSNATTGLGNIATVDLTDYDFGVQRQLDRFRSLIADGKVKVGSTDLFFVEAGPNDLMNSLFDPNADAADTVRSMASNLAGAARQLFATGARTVLVWDIPHIEQAPNFNSTTLPADQQPLLALVRQAIKEMSDAGRATLDKELAAVKAPDGGNLVTVRLSRLQEHLVANARQLGFTRPVTEGCIDTFTQAVCSTDRAVQNQYLFIDHLHLAAPAQAYEAAYYATLIDQIDGGVNRRAARLADIGIDAARLSAGLAAAGLNATQAKSEGFALFADSGWSRRKAAGDGADATLTVKAATAGIAYGDGDGWRLALGGGPLDGHARYSAGGRFSLSGGQVVVQGANQWGAFHLRSSISHAWYELSDITRPGGLPTLMPTADSKGESDSLSLKAAWRLDAGGLYLEPGIGVDWDRAKVNAYRERDGAGLEMAVERLSREEWAAAASLSAGFEPVDLGSSLHLSGRLNLNYRRLLERPGTSTTASLIDNTARPIHQFIPDGKRDRVSVEPALHLAIGDNAVLSVRYAGQVTGEGQDVVRAGFAWRF